MKLALYVEDQTTQVVITPESDWEKSALSKIPEDGSYRLHRGKFYRCRGGWTMKDSGYHDGLYDSGDAKDDASLIFVMDEPPREEPK